MIMIGIPCDFCHMPTVAHCYDAKCGLSRCPRCRSYGRPGENMVEWRKDDYFNPYSLLDIKTEEPQRQLPAWLEESYGVQRNGEAPDA